jgi:predicted alpha/beta hydrolase
MDVAIVRQDLVVASGDGHRARLLLLLPNAAKGGLLFAPALGVPARKYLGFAQALAEQGIAVALHELRGLDTSDWRAGWRKDWGYRELLADLSASRAALAAQHPSLRWRLGGHSLGAQLAALSIVQEPAESGLAIVASGQPWWRRFPLWKRPFVLGVFLWFRGMSLLCGHFPGETLGFGGREARGVIRDWTRTGISGRYAIRDVEFDFERALSETSGPVLALRMAHDPLVPRGSLDHLLAKLPRARVTRDEIPPAEFERGRADHFAWMKDPGPVVRRIAAWAA